MENHQDEGDYVKAELYLMLIREQIYCKERGKWERSLLYFVFGMRWDKLAHSLK